MTLNEMKAWVDTASYEDLLHKWRFDSIKSPWFVGEIGAYYKNVMAKKKSADHAAAVRK